MSLPEKPTQKKPNYLVVFAALAFFTAVEIAVTYFPVQRIYFLVPLALIKASLVVLYFMHLKFDQKVFRVVFIMGVLMGISLIIVMTVLFVPKGF